MGGLSKAVLEQKDLLKNNLQVIIDWASKNPDDLNVNSLFDWFSSSFGPDSQIFNNYEQILQELCGKRAECLERRRESLLLELPNKNVQSAQRKVPPSSEYLFSKEKLNPLIQYFGGSQSWLNPPSYVHKRPTQEKMLNRSRTSTRYPPSGRSFQTSKEHYQQRRNNYRFKNNNIKESKGKPHDDSFRKKGDK